MKFREHIISLMFLLFFVFMLSYPMSSIDAAMRGIRLFADIIFPSLFPFFVLTALLPSIPWVNVFATFISPVTRKLFNVSGYGAIVFFSGSVSGFPTGAKMTADLLEKNKISIPDANRLICFTNGASPMFLIGAVAGGLMSQPTLGSTLFLCHLTGNIIIGIAAGKYIKGPSFHADLTEREPVDYLTLFREAISSSVRQLLTVGGLIVFFSVLIESCNQLLEEIYTGAHHAKINLVISGILELSNGAESAASASSTYIAAILILSMTSFSGLCIHMQILSFISHLPISYQSYFYSRLLHAVISPLIFVIYTYLFPLKTDSPAVKEVIAPVEYGITSAQVITLSLIILGILTFLMTYRIEKSRF
ncbi:hypothetical protein KP77_17360 [Jeotgalibacillus alimentarius]|uniref:Sporulation integral membrane protein YlbJ n=1 Tax=Jeotgalibacillus alimentarius TaxID=135826 RepID=A0A0C2W162_9BACL|nr:hypothetical protein [Jeotgalibacillus alimentarius]KIL50361.1 hypothetical protein KP77_17360 [Jeotgalibacillus alimentarius]